MNIKKHIKTLLQKIGLTESEIAVYLTVHQNPKITLSELQKKTKFSTATVYRAFDKLKGLGLITSSQSSWKKNIEAISLRSIGEKLAREQRKLRKTELELKRLDNLFNLSERSFIDEPVQIYSDKNQIIEKYFRILSQSWDQLKAYGSGETLIDILGTDPEHQFVQHRSKQGKKANLIMTELGPYGQELQNSDEKFLRNTKLVIDPSNQNFMTYIYGNEVSIINRDEQCGDRTIVIKDPLMVRHYQTMFDSIWSRSK